jgi:hypothetical protein
MIAAKYKVCEYNYSKYLYHILIITDQSCLIRVLSFHTPDMGLSLV